MDFGSGRSGLNADGSFGNDPALEVEVPPGKTPSEISKIIFDEQGRMFLAERGAPSGAFDFQTLTKSLATRVLRYSIENSYPGAPRIWSAVPNEYAIGFPPDHRHSNGGVALGYNYDSLGRFDRASCGGYLWSTGELLRIFPKRDVIVQMRKFGPLDVNGLQGNLIGLVRPMNEPPNRAYFIDYDDRFRNDGLDLERGHLGDVAIWLVCGPVLRGGWMLPGWMSDWWWWEGGSGLTTLPPPVKLACSPDQQQPGFQCCPKGASPSANGTCTPWCPSGAMDPQSQNYCGLGLTRRLSIRTTRRN